MSIEAKHSRLLPLRNLGESCGTVFGTERNYLCLHHGYDQISIEYLATKSYYFLDYPNILSTKRLSSSVQILFVCGLERF